VNFLRLIRPVNLAIIAITMYGVRYYIYSFSPELFDNEYDFGLLVFSTLLIAAGGNIINDYFDVKADRINKPDRLIISKSIKRRWAIVSHWVFNVIAFLIAMYLCWKHSTFWYIFIHFTSISFLWWYSAKLKKIAVIGNLVISALSVLVIFLTVLFTLKVNDAKLINHILFNSNDALFNISIFWIVFIFMLMAFLQNLSRELVKDIEDVAGDQLIHAKTLPMLIGEKNTLKIIGILLILFPISYLPGTLFYYTDFNWVLSLPITIAALLNCLLFLLSFTSFKWKIIGIKTGLKVSMFSGIIYLFLHS